MRNSFPGVSADQKADLLFTGDGEAFNVCVIRSKC